MCCEGERYQEEAEDENKKKNRKGVSGVISDKYFGWIGIGKTRLTHFLTANVRQLCLPISSGLGCPLVSSLVHFFYRCGIPQLYKVHEVFEVSKVKLKNLQRACIKHVVLTILERIVTHYTLHFEIMDLPQSVKKLVKHTVNYVHLA